MARAQFHKPMLNDMLCCVLVIWEGALAADLIRLLIFSITSDVLQPRRQIPLENVVSLAAKILISFPDKAWQPTQT